MDEANQESAHREIIQAAARVLVDAVTRLIEADPHQWSKRPCQTCAAVSTILGQPFGCLKRAKL